MGRRTRLGNRVLSGIITRGVQGRPRLGDRVLWRTFLWAAAQPRGWW